MTHFETPEPQQPIIPDSYPSLDEAVRLQMGQEARQLTQAAPVEEGLAVRGLWKATELFWNGLEWLCR